MIEIQMKRHKQSGMLGVILCAMLAAGFLIYSLQTVSSSSMKLYHAANQGKIEVAEQLFAAGAQLIALRISSMAQLKAFYNAHHAGNSYTCSASAELPLTLPTIGEIPAPDVGDDQQNLKLRVAFAPFSCTYGLMSEDNFRVNLEIVANVGCGNGNGNGNTNAEDCVSRTVAFGMKNSPLGVPYNGGGTESVATVTTPPPLTPEQILINQAQEAAAAAAAAAQVEAEAIAAAAQAGATAESMAAQAAATAASQAAQAAATAAAQAAQAAATQASLNAPPPTQTTGSSNTTTNTPSSTPTTTQPPPVVVQPPLVPLPPVVVTTPGGSSSSGGAASSVSDFIFGI